MKTLVKHIKANAEKLYILSDQGLVSGANFLISILIARYLGIEEYGLFALGWMVVLFTSSLHQAFIIMPLYTLYPKQDNKAQYLSNLMGLQVLFCAISFVVILVMVKVVLYFTPEWDRPYLALTLASISVLFVLNDYLRRLFFAMHRPIIVLIMDCIGYGLQPIILFYLSYQSFPLSIPIILVIINLLFAISIGIALFSKYEYGISFSNFKDTLKLNWKFSRYLIGTSLLQWVSGNLFIIMAGSLIGSAAVGTIRIAQNIMGVLHVLFLAMENIVPVRAAELLKNNGRHSMLRYIGKISKQAAIPTGILIGLIVIFKSQIITALYGESFLDYKYILVSFCGLYVLIFIGTLVRFIIRTIENNKIIFISYVASTVLSLILAKPLVQHLEINGVILGLFLVQILTISIYFISLKSDLKWLFK